MLTRNCYLSNQGLNQVEYSSDSGSDGYYSCKEEAIPYKNLESTLIIGNLTSSPASKQEDEVLAVTLRSGKQLENPSSIINHTPSEIPKEANNQRGEKKTQDIPEAVTTRPHKLTTEDGRPTPLLYPTSTRRKR
ncbi:hypothetical protein PIB30_009579 [Stylosanthes scabra]|uniref:Uncharacterized protein n=1 Tax=Stylosanthes scabra TaxID=79078 RepID=A0ABU6Q5A7_9FABA|nr:hypothetical protein [Stylosanthes scabra]